MYVLLFLTWQKATVSDFTLSARCFLLASFPELRKYIRESSTGQGSLPRPKVTYALELNSLHDIQCNASKSPRLGSFQDRQFGLDSWLQY